MFGLRRKKLKSHRLPEPFLSATHEFALILSLMGMVTWFGHHQSQSTNPVPSLTELVADLFPGDPIEICPSLMR